MEQLEGVQKPAAGRARTATDEGGTYYLASRHTGERLAQLEEDLRIPSIEQQKDASRDTHVRMYLRTYVSTGLRTSVST